MSTAAVATSSLASPALPPAFSPSTVAPGSLGPAFVAAPTLSATSVIPDARQLQQHVCGAADMLLLL